MKTRLKSTTNNTTDNTTNKRNKRTPNHNKPAKRAPGLGAILST